MSALTDLVLRIQLDRRQPPPVVVFDIDSTLLSTGERNHMILHEFASQIGAPADLAPILQKITPAEMGWNIVDDLRNRGFDHEPTLGRLRTFWMQRFFRNDYLHHDVPLPGAVEYVLQVHAAGATIFYLTGRDEPNMGDGTRRSLKNHGFPVAERTMLRLKPRFEDDDLIFKRRLFPEIAATGPVVAAFENEPLNANVFAETFEDAVVFFLMTVHSPNPPPLLPRIVRLKDFR